MEDLIGYERLTQEALRGVVRDALLRAASSGGLPGRHHFYITFRTRAPGVSIPEHLAQRYPEEMTIVLEHQFWDLDVRQDQFRVILKFGGQPHAIVCPFRAITRFFDPSVRFALHFESADEPQSEPAIEPVEEQQEAPKAAAAVVSLDAFRKK